jgi:protein-disulfide isomerase
MSSLKIPVGPEDHAQGDADASVTLVEYGDYECPHCGRAYPIVKQIQKHYGKKLCFVFRNFPLSEMHLHAEGAAESAEFAGAHHKFWPMHDLLFENQERLGGALYLEIAQSLGLEPAGLRKALETREFAARVKTDFSGGVRSGVNGTPTFFINGRRHDAPFDYQDLKEAIDAELSRVAKAAGA